jgi:midasin (ATPase involved in ribosome maturation)
MDSKSLLGTYVCTENGEFTFQKGPLIKAMEQGLWLVIRDIEKGAGDIISTLIPAVRERQIELQNGEVVVSNSLFRVFGIQGGLDSEFVDILQGVKEATTKENEGLRVALSDFTVIRLSPMTKEKILKLCAKFRVLSKSLALVNLVLYCCEFIQLKLSKSYLHDNRAPKPLIALQ